MSEQNSYLPKSIVEPINGDLVNDSLPSLHVTSNQPDENHAVQAPLNSSSITLATPVKGEPGSQTTINTERTEFIPNVTEGIKNYPNAPFTDRELVIRSYLKRLPERKQEKMRRILDSEQNKINIQLEKHGISPEFLQETSTQVMNEVRTMLSDMGISLPHGIDTVTLTLFGGQYLNALMQEPTKRSDWLAFSAPGEPAIYVGIEELLTHEKNNESILREIKKLIAHEYIHTISYQSYTKGSQRVFADEIEEILYDSNDKEAYEKRVGISIHRNTQFNDQLGTSLNEALTVTLANEWARKYHADEIEYVDTRTYQREINVFSLLCKVFGEESGKSPEEVLHFFTQAAFSATSFRELVRQLSKPVTKVIHKHTESQNSEQLAVTYNRI